MGETSKSKEAMKREVSDRMSEYTEKKNRESYQSQVERQVTWRSDVKTNEKKASGQRVQHVTVDNDVLFSALAFLIHCLV